MRFRVAAAVVFTAVWLVPATPVHAQSMSDSTLGVRLVQEAAGGDEVQLYGLDRSSSQPSPGGDNSPWGSGGETGARNTRASYNSASLDYYANDAGLIHAIGKDLNIAPASASYDEPLNSDGGNYPDTEVQMNLDESLYSRNGSTFTLNVPTATLASTAADYGYQQVQIGICPLSIGGKDQSTRAPDDIDGNSSCRWWNEAANKQTFTHATLKFVENPSSASYWRVVAWHILAVALLTLALGIPAWLLRKKKLSTLGTGNMVIAILAAGLAWLAAVIAMILIYSTTDALDEITLANGYSANGKALLAVFTGMLYALPFLLPAIVLSLVPPPEFIPAQQQMNQGFAPQPQQTGPGVPSWLGAQTGAVPQVPQVQAPATWAPAPHPPQQPPGQAEEPAEHEPVHPPPVPPPPVPPPPVSPPSWNPPA